MHNYAARLVIRFALLAVLALSAVVLVALGMQPV
jgi:hypothetical protein